MNVEGDDSKCVLPDIKPDIIPEITSYPDLIVIWNIDIIPDIRPDIMPNIIYRHHTVLLYGWWFLSAVGCLNNDRSVMSKAHAWHLLAILPILKGSASTDTAWGEDWLQHKHLELYHRSMDRIIQDINDLCSRDIYPTPRTRTPRYTLFQYNIIYDIVSDIIPYIGYHSYRIYVLEFFFNMYSTSGWVAYIAWFVPAGRCSNPKKDKGILLKY